MTTRWPRRPTGSTRPNAPTDLTPTESPLNPERFNRATTTSSNKSTISNRATISRPRATTTSNSRATTHKPRTTTTSSNRAMISSRATISNSSATARLWCRVSLLRLARRCLWIVLAVQSPLVVICRRVPTRWVWWWLIRLRGARSAMVSVCGTRIGSRLSWSRAALM